MPIMPTTSTLKANAVGILNAIRDNASADYFNAVPQANETTESIRAVGQAIMAFQPRKNEFVNALVNRIIKVVVTSKLYRNPLAFAKKGMLEYGETIEEIFVDLAQAEGYDWTTSVDEAQLAFKRANPDIKSAFHALNMQTRYKATISDQNLRQAFLSASGVTDLISRIVNSIYSAANYDEYIMTKYTIAQNMLAGNNAMRTAGAVTDETSGKAIVKAVKKTAGDFKFMNSNFNIAGVNNYTPSDDEIFVLMTTDVQAAIDVDVLAAAFNMSKTEFMGHIVVVDSFGFSDGEKKRLDEILGNDPGYTGISDDDNTALKTVQLVMFDRDYTQIYDVLNEFTEQYNAALLYWNEFLHVWKIYSTSPFVNFVGFTTTTPSITNVAVTVPSNAEPEDWVQAVASVSATDFANKGVTWSISPTTNVTIDSESGLIHFGAAASGAYTVTATSVFNTEKKGNGQITVS